MSGDVLSSGVGSRASQPKRKRKVLRRSYLPPLVAVIFLTIGEFLFGGAQPASALVVSGCLILSAVVCVLFAGPQFATLGMVAGAAAVWIYAASGGAGALDRAAPELAVLFAAGGLWTVGYVCARQRGALDIAWSTLIWASCAFCLLTCFRTIGGAVAGFGSVGGVASAFDSPASAAVLFGLFALIGAARTLHVIKRMDAEALSRSAMVDRLFSEALGGLLLLGFSMTCLVLSGSVEGVLLSLCVLMLLISWDTSAITQRPHRSPAIRWLARVMPLIGLGLGGWGIALAFLQDETVAHTAARPETLPRIQRLAAYFNTWLERPALGHGLGSIDAVRDQSMTLANAEALMPPGGAQNVLLDWLVQAGVIGTLAFALVMAAILAGIVRGFSVHKAPRTFMRLALAATLFLALHGAADSSIDLPGVVWLYALLLGAACGIAAGQRTARGDRPA